MQNAEWHFLMARARMAGFYYLDALHLIDTACCMDPNNTEYQAVREEISAKAEEYGGGYRLSKKHSWGKNSENSFGERCCECLCEGGCECCCEILDGIG